MSDKYVNKEGVYVDIHTDSNGKDHVEFYDKIPRDPSHTSIHINLDSKTGSGNIVDTTSGSKETTNTSCYLTTACLKHFKKNFNDNCYELMMLRWFRDNFVSQEDIEHYYIVAPLIVESIDRTVDRDEIYNYIYHNVVDVCVGAIKQGDFDFAYNRYKNSVLSLEEEFVRPLLTKKLVYALRLKK